MNIGYTTERAHGRTLARDRRHSVLETNARLLVTNEIWQRGMDRGLPRSPEEETALTLDLELSEL